MSYLFIIIFYNTHVCKVSNLFSHNHYINHKNKKKLICSFLYEKKIVSLQSLASKQLVSFLIIILPFNNGHTIQQQRRSICR